MDQFAIRFAEHRDLAGVLRLYQVLRPNDPVLSAHDADARWREVLGQPHLRVVVAQVGERLVSTAMIAVIANLASHGRPFAAIEHVVTLPEFRGQGLGRATMQFALEFAWRRDCCKVMLLSGAQRPEAHKLYESLGFDGDVERGFVVKPRESQRILMTAEQA
jgi:GNAT superfamily N-acetyltransferase